MWGEYSFEKAKEPYAPSPWLITDVLLILMYKYYNDHLFLIVIVHDCFNYDFCLPLRWSWSSSSPMRSF